MLAEAETDGNALRTANSVHDHETFGMARGRCPNTAAADRAKDAEPLEARAKAIRAIKR